jgi:CheY-like chemotaxis protein
VRLAANGAEALAAQRERAADVLITDIFMPDCDGFEAIDAFRRAYPGTRIIAMSGDARLAQHEYLAAAALIGVDATLKKPFQTDSLLRALRALESASGQGKSTDPGR